MFAWLRNLVRPPPPPAHPREAAGILTAILCFRRAWLEAQANEEPTLSADLDEDRRNLLLFTGAAGLDDPFLRELLDTPVGSLDPSAYLEAHWGIEAAAAIAWALTLCDALPSERADVPWLLSLCPLDLAEPPPEWSRRRLRERAELEGALEKLRSRLDDLRPETGAETEVLAWSRTFERARGLAWVLDTQTSLREVDPRGGPR